MQTTSLNWPHFRQGNFHVEEGSVKIIEPDIRVLENYDL